MLPMRPHWRATMRWLDGGFISGGCLGGLIAATSRWSPPTDHVPMRLLVLLQLLLVISLMVFACNRLSDRLWALLAWAVILVSSVVAALSANARLTNPKWLGLVGAIGYFLLVTVAGPLGAFSSRVHVPFAITVLIFGTVISLAAVWFLLRQEKQMPPPQ